MEHASVKVVVWNRKNKLLNEQTLFNDMNKQKEKITGFMNVNYLTIEDKDKIFLGTLVNNTLSLSVLLNETVE